MSSALYQEMPLPSPTSIRLLKATPNDSASGDLSYSLSAFELQDIPSYSALSYTWGNPLPSEGPDEDSLWLAESHSIHCNGYSVGVKLNLFESLTSLAKLQYDDYIWIDALCIDQNTLSERNSQVSLIEDLLQGTRNHHMAGKRIQRYRGHRVAAQLLHTHFEGQAGNTTRTIPGIRRYTGPGP